MKKVLPQLTLVAGMLLLHVIAFAQDELAPGQNPAYAVSRTKYMQLADSVNQWHSTTTQETYKAIDWLADRKAERLANRAARRDYRRQRYNWNNDYYSGNYGYRRSWHPSRNFYYPRPYSNSYRRPGSIFLNPWGIGYWW